MKRVLLLALLVSCIAPTALIGVSYYKSDELSESSRWVLDCNGEKFRGDTPFTKGSYSGKRWKTIHEAITQYDRKPAGWVCGELGISGL